MGKNIQIVPHITNEIKEKMYKAGESADIVIIEIGGVVGNLEIPPFLEAARQLVAEVGTENAIFVHVTLVPYIAGSNELKTFPTQLSVKALQSAGISPSIIVCRTEYDLTDEIKSKISLFCNVTKQDVIQNLTLDCLYEVPLALENEGMAKMVCHHLKLKNVEPNNIEWSKMIQNIKKIDKQVKIGIVGKYVQLHDAYLSVMESLYHAGFANNVNVEICFIDSETITRKNVKTVLNKMSGILVPGGFGSRGVEGMAEAIRYARENNVPFFGICLGMQMAVIEFSRNVLGCKDANSAEFDSKTKDPVIHIMEEQKKIKNKGATMRLGNYPCKMVEGTKCRNIYGQDLIMERHRHRYEYNNDYRKNLENAGLKIAGLSPDGNLVEMVEYTKHPWFIGVQFHPELKSRPDRAQPLFADFVRASSGVKELRK